MSDKKDPTRDRPRRMRSSVSAEEILRSAERVAQGGFDALTMRAVASEMGASPMALYRYFATKDDLVDAMLDRVLGRIELESPTDDWVADLTAFAMAHRTVLAGHAWAIIPLFTHSNPGVNATVIGEVAFEILSRAGITGADAVATFSGLLALNYGWFAFTTARDATRDSVDPEAMLAASIEDIPADRFPLTIANAGELSNYGSHAHYALALRQMIEGIRTVAHAV